MYPNWLFLYFYTMTVRMVAAFFVFFFCLGHLRKTDISYPFSPSPIHLLPDIEFSTTVSINTACMRCSIFSKLEVDSCV